MGRKRHTRVPHKPKASTEDILGGSPKANNVPAKWVPHHRRLLELRSKLLHRQDDLARDANEENPTFSSHMADAGTDSYDRDLALSILSSEQDALYQIDQALDRIRQGTYGKCELTGKPIERPRLEAIPWARFSVSAERQLEEQGARKTTKLNPRDTVTHVTTAEEKNPEEE